MVAYLNPSVRVATETRDAAPSVHRSENPSGSAPAAPRPSRLRSISKRIWTFLVEVISGPGLGVSGGIDDSAMPSGFMAPYGRGSRQVRNLWHQPF